MQHTGGTSTLQPETLVENVTVWVPSSGENGLHSTVRCMSELGKLLSAFIEERVDGPLKGEEDLWQEAVFAGLFSVAFEATMRLSDVRKGPESLQQTVTGVIEEVTACAAVWVNQRLSPKPRWWSKCQITLDVSQLMRHRLTGCFNEALAVMSEKGWSLETGRSHACFVLLNGAATALMIRGLIPDKEAAKVFIENAMEGCDSMAGELARELDKRLQR